MITEQYSKIVSSETRKIVTALIVTVFGLSYENGGFTISKHLALQIALGFFFLYLFLDISQYIRGITLAKNDNDANQISEKIYFLFIGKLIAAMVGLVFCAFNVFGVLSGV
ncbi:MAG: hypothetical protein PF486_09780 [Prolixibacteraceae bacterium]|jgi:hypothetical protein|nr:hypothetical protein [Prolixibacteraceae bacterium]